MSNVIKREAVSAARQTSSVAAFSHPAFRLYFGGQLVSVSGTWMQGIAQQIVVYNLTNSKFALGLVACAQGLPALFLMPFAGVIVERLARRKVLLFTQTVMMILAFIMAGLSFANILQFWHIMVLSALLGAVTALDAPARQSFVVEMVGHEHLTSGITMNSIMFNSARIIGPAIGGVAIATVGATGCFILNGFSFLAVIISLLAMKVQSVGRALGKIDIWRPLLEGFQFIRSHPTIGPLITLSAITSLLGTTYSTLITPFADKVLGNTELGTSALNTAQGIGAVIAGIVVARISTGGQRGRVMSAVAIMAPIAVMLFAFTTNLTASFPFIGIAGFGFTCQYILMNILIQSQVPDEFRGRVLSFYTLTFFGLSPLGNLAIGAVAQVIDTVPAIVLYGGLCLAGVGIILWRAPQLWKLK